MGEPLTFDGVNKEFFSGGKDEILGFFLFFRLGFQYPFYENITQSYANYGENLA